ATDDAKEQDMRERFDAVKRIVETQLSDTQRRVLWMRDYEGYSFAEIAAAVDMTEENVRQTLSRARKQIRETYKNIN
ncbi:MAG: sigma-70 region 4 domain-containing protein, partial [Prevotella sp.]|nr:sigma-70 region 4 domain-containing protein [Prevotella sp.]